MRQFISEKHLEALMSLYSKRDLPMKSREAIRLRVMHGHTYEMAELITGVSRRNISKHINKLKKAHQIMLKTYGGISDT